MWDFLKGRESLVMNFGLLHYETAKLRPKRIMVKSSSELAASFSGIVHSLMSESVKESVVFSQCFHHFLFLSYSDHQ